MYINILLNFISKPEDCNRDSQSFYIILLLLDVIFYNWNILLYYSVFVCIERCNDFTNNLVGLSFMAYQSL